MTDARHTGFWGQTGTGKSHEVKRRLAEHPRVVVIDVNDEFSQSSTRRVGPLREAMTLTELRRYPQKLLEADLSLAIVGLDPINPKSAARAVITVARLQASIAESTGKAPPRLLLVCDEAGTYSQHCARELAALATTGGQHLSVTLWVIAQRPSLVPKTVRSQLKELVLFHVAEPADLEAIEERTHDESMSDKLRALPNTFTKGKKPFITWSAAKALAVVPKPAAVEPEDDDAPPEPVAAREPTNPQKEVGT